MQKLEPVPNLDTIEESVFTSPSTARQISETQRHDRERKKRKEVEARVKEANEKERVLWEEYLQNPTPKKGCKPNKERVNFKSTDRKVTFHINKPPREIPLGIEIPAIARSRGR